MMHKSYIFVNIYITHIKTINNLVVQVYDTNQIWLHLNFLTIVQGNKKVVNEIANGAWYFLSPYLYMIMQR